MVVIKVIKRDGSSVEYDREKIKIAISKANNEVNDEEKISLAQINNIIKYIESLNIKNILHIDIQEHLLEKQIQQMNQYLVCLKIIIHLV